MKARQAVSVICFRYQPKLFMVSSLAFLIPYVSSGRTLVRLHCVAANCEASFKFQTCFGALYLYIFIAATGTIINLYN